MALKYTTVSRMLSVLPMIGSVSNLSSSDIVNLFAIPAESIIDGYLVRNYTLPIAGTIPILQALADDISLYRILSRRVFTQEKLQDSVWPDRFKEAEEMLQKIADGEILLVDSNGNLVTARTDLADVRSTKDSYLPTFHEGAAGSHVQDPNKLDDIGDDRDF